MKLELVPISKGASRALASRVSLRPDETADLACPITFL